MSNIPRQLTSTEISYILSPYDQDDIYFLVLTQKLATIKLVPSGIDELKRRLYGMVKSYTSMRTTMSSTADKSVLSQTNPIIKSYNMHEKNTDSK